MEDAKPRPFGEAVAEASPLGVFLLPSRAGPLELLRSVFSSSDGTLPHTRCLIRGFAKICALRAGPPGRS